MIKFRLSPVVTSALALLGMFVLDAAPTLAATVAGGDPTGASAGSPGGNLTSFATGYLMPVVAGIGGIACGIGAIGGMMRPDKKEFMTHMTSIGAAGLVGGGSITAIGHWVGGAANNGTSGAVVMHIAPHLHHVAHVAAHFIR